MTTSTEIRSVRQTRAGDVLVELGPKTKNKEGFWEVFSRVLGESAAVRSLEPKSFIEIRDLDYLTIEEEVEVPNAITRDVGDLSEDAKVTLTKVNTRDQKMAIVELGEREATKRLQPGWIKIGWVYARVRRRTVLTRCYACFGFGHRQSECNRPDRKKRVPASNAASRPLKTNCRAEPRCFLCEERGTVSAALNMFPFRGLVRISGRNYKTGDVDEDSTRKPPQ